MFNLPKLLVVVLVIVAVWYAVRSINRVRRAMPQRHPAQSRPAGPVITAEDLVRCEVCGTYIAASARRCGKASCPRPA